MCGSEKSHFDGSRKIHLDPVRFVLKGSHYMIIVMDFAVVSYTVVTNTIPVGFIGLTIKNNCRRKLCTVISNKWYEICIFFVEKLVEGKVLSAEFESAVKSSATSEKSLSVTELEQAIADVHRILQIVGEQVRIRTM